MSKKLLVICGPTATGKTGLGIKLAQKFNGEIISADSRQVYQGMDIGTGKNLPVNAKLKIKNEKLQIKIKNGQTLKPYRFGEVPVWLYDVVKPDYWFSVADYLNCAEAVIKDIWRRGRLPLMVGGTGLYVKGFVNGIETVGVEPDWRLRQQLSDLAIKQLRKKLRELDPGKWERMNESDRENPRRLVRAIEIALKLKTQNSKVKTIPKSLLSKPTGQATQKSKPDTLSIGLTAPRKILYQRIDRRVEERVKKGARNEVKGLLRMGYSWDLPSMQTMGYKEWRLYFEGEQKDKKGELGSIQEGIIQRWQFNEHAYARRQMTWFKKDKRINWFDITWKGFEKEIVKLVRRWYSKGDD